ncbi:hypothetical protein EUA02_25715 [Mycobacterium paragordonae]|uniref:DUF7257 domain-containing protein n=1 Tax=Mycobacterium paragordonae TaxID=1389713 RepID=UPI00105F9805|nr:hypothetical protein [Mycobacterium paragordonae]TDK88805.1 hypothetical protein EUA02_25715 [Mycobacterium paragordonae]TDK95987.1 hypothetical protein EUA05_32580 [Mycobacterium paragordonae]
MADLNWAPYAISADGANSAIHGPLPRAGGELSFPFTWQQLQQIVANLVNEFLRQVAVALGAIEIFGFKPYEALVEIGEKIQEGVDNFNILLTAFGLPTVNDVATLLSNQANDFATFLAATGQATFAALGAALQALIDFLTAIPANLLSGAMPTTVTLSGTQLGTLLQYINSSGQFAAAQLTGALNTGLTFSGTALSVLLQYLNSSGQFSAAQLTGGINTAVTFGGTALSTLLQYLNSSGQFAAGQLTGAINGSLTLGGVTLSTLVTNINSSGQLLAAGITGALGTGLTVGGVTLSTLFTNINSSGQLLGAGITGAINTAATVGGTALSTLSTNWNTAVTNVNSLITNAGASIADVNSLINTASTNAQGVINAVNNAAAGVTSGASSLLSVAATNLSALLGSAPTNLLGTTGVYGQAATDSAYAAVAAAAAAQAAEQTRINSAFNAVFNVSPATAGNVSQTIDFTSMANQTGMSGIMLPGTGSGNGYLGVTSGQAMWQGGTSALNSVGDLEVFPTTTTSDYQVVTVTLGSLNDSPTSNKVEGYVLARCNSARDTFLMLRIYTNGSNIVVSLHCMVSGTFTTFSGAAAIVATAAPGGSLRWVIGDPTSASEYALQVLYNGTPVITYTDSSHNSQKGSSYRYVGLGAFVSSVGGAGKFPAGIRTVTYQDNPPAPSSYPFSGTPTAGTKGRMYVSNDVGLIQRDNGTAWEYIWGGPLGYLTKPPSSGWSWVNQGTATTATELGGERITAPSSTRNWRMRVRSLSPTSNYSARCYVEVAAKPTDAWFTGLVLRDTVTQSFITFGVGLVSSPAGYNAHLGVNRWASSTTFNSESWHQTSYLLPGGAIPQWLGISDDGTNRYFQFSHNGVDWITAFSESRAAYFTPNQFGFGASNEGSGADLVIRLRSLSGIS